MTKLLIVESPSKAKTIQKYLGSDYVVRASVGHVCDIQPFAKDVDSVPREFRNIGVFPMDNWKVNYQVSDDKQKVVSELRSLAKKADFVYLATDPDREGEAISWHLKNVLKLKEGSYARVRFSEITKKAILKALDAPDSIDMNLVNAQQTRRLIDRIVGFQISPLLWERLGRGLSAGRVQSVAVKMVVEREQSIAAFEPKEFWNIQPVVVTPAGETVLELYQQNQQKMPDVLTQTQAEQIKRYLQSQTFTVDDVKTELNESKPSAPFTTSTLQQTASSVFGWSVRTVMSTAQQLYEKGLITYMRTDSTYITPEAVASIRSVVTQEFGASYISETPRVYKVGANAQEAHEAVRPTDVSVRSVTYMDERCAKLYGLIWARAVASQMASAVYSVGTVTVSAGEFTLQAKGKKTHFDGYMKVYAKYRNSKEAILPEFVVGQPVRINRIDTEQNFTKPAPRYGEPGLVKELEKRGIGRPSTYATIITTVQDRGYVEQQNKAFVATTSGQIVTQCLNQSFPDLMDYQFSAKLEEQMDAISRGERVWTSVLDSFYSGFKQELEKAKDKTTGMMHPNPVFVPSLPCELCARPMQLRYGRGSLFMGCSGFNASENPCKNTKSLKAMPTSDHVVAEKCPVCNSHTREFQNPEFGVKVCVRSPECSGVTVIASSLPPVVGVPCNCGGSYTKQEGKFGPFWRCADCSSIKKADKQGNILLHLLDPIVTTFPTTKAKDVFVLRESVGGSIFLAAKGFPKNRETRQPTSVELKSLKSQLPASHHYLTEAPDADEHGNPFVLTTDRTTKTLCFVSMKDNKPVLKLFWIAATWRKA